MTATSEHMPQSSGHLTLRTMLYPRGDLAGAGAEGGGMPIAASLLIGGLLIAASLLVGAAGAHTTHPCPCRYAGGVAPPGAVVCIEVDGKRSLARCEMVLNNSSWRFLDRPCPIASPTRPARPIG
jgi:hypothetical protein